MHIEPVLLFLECTIYWNFERDRAALAALAAKPYAKPPVSQRSRNNEDWLPVLYCIRKRACISAYNAPELHYKRLLACI